MSPARRLGIALVALSVLLGGLFVGQQFGLGTGYSLAESEGKLKPRDYLGGLNKEGFRLESFDKFQELVTRPVFNEDRKPTPIEEKPAEGAAVVAAVPDLDVTLTSIIHTADKKLAIVRDNKSNLSMVVKLGMPLEGEQSGWKLVEVDPRKVVFEGEGSGRKELELSVNESAISRPEGAPPAPDGQVPANMNNSAPPAVAANQAESDAANQAKAEEIRRRIEERRRQLREEAERMRAQESSQ